MNRSKAVDGRRWKVWAAAGAIASTSPTPLLMNDDLIITGVCTHLAGPAAGFQTLSLGERVVNFGLGWSVSKPAHCVVVPNKDYKLGTRLPRLPGNAVPVDKFFSRI